MNDQQSQHKEIDDSGDVHQFEQVPSSKQLAPSEHTIANHIEPVRTGANTSEDWLNVDESVLLCTKLGLHRTPKTVRKWASQSHGLEPATAELIVRRQDTTNGRFRYRIERASLEQKIKQELELQQNPADDASELVHTGANKFEHVPTTNKAEPREHTDANLNKLVHTSSSDETDIVQALKSEISFLRSELTHRRTTDGALQDVIKTVGTNAQAQLLQAQNKQRELDQKHSRLHKEGDNSIVRNNESTIE